MNDDSKWQALLAASASTFAGEAGVPFGLTTRLLARVRDERRQREVVERIGLRAVFAALTALTVAAGVTWIINLRDGGDVEPGVRSLAAVENVQPF